MVAAKVIDAPLYDPAGEKMRAWTSEPGTAAIITGTIEAISKLS